MLFTTPILIEDPVDVDIHELMVEICDNAIDDDGDGLIDINDSDCICQITTQAKLIPNPSFEDISCCESTISVDIDCLDDWKSFNSSQTFVFHPCQPFTSIDQLQPYADGESAVGFSYNLITLNGDTSINNNYIAICLYRPMLKDSSYTIKFDLGFLNFNQDPVDRFELSFFGSASCNNIPAISSSFLDLGVIDRFTTICPTFLAEWSELNQVTVVSENDGLPHWVGDSIVITPDEDIYAIAIGGPCTIPSEAISAEFLFDNLRLDGEGSYQDASQGSQCDPNFLLGVN